MVNQCVCVVALLDNHNLFSILYFLRKFNYYQNLLQNLIMGFQSKMCYPYLLMLQSHFYRICHQFYCYLNCQKYFHFPSIDHFSSFDIFSSHYYLCCQHYDFDNISTEKYPNLLHILLHIVSYIHPKVHSFQNDFLTLISASLQSHLLYTQRAAKRNSAAQRNLDDQRNFS